MEMINLEQRLNVSYEQLGQLCQAWNIIELALFGSVLREDFNSNSDIDILVSFAENARITFFDLDIIEAQLSQLFNRPVDLVTKKSILNTHNWIRRKNILENTKIIYEQR
ncbi:DNA polymerase beta domain protein region [Gloeothece citriformis PCC 7424]|uniref:DNA polymerase beta domain protein region n=1 Tax=Gloeothece citriformis (strain PCC 7424) TaxID=65393 RepID=B7KKF2_GLOC7|nr:nucleotidyltransferase domain-containing protein [Gloeothece citriformis]ACK72285.1 DNA polymerase beta domain protein region [Gloeothece citriformis PCC 7424]